jgi:hypothetical protein
MEASQAKRARIQGVGPHKVLRCCEVSRHRTTLPSLLVIVLCLESSAQRSENAQQILKVLGESKRLRSSFDLELLPPIAGSPAAYGLRALCWAHTRALGPRRKRLSNVRRFECCAHGV